MANILRVCAMLAAAVWPVLAQTVLAQTVLAQTGPAQTGPGQAQDGDARRLALVIGNGAYGSVAALDNPVNDARLIAGALTALDFQVALITDATQITMKRAIAQFGRDLRKEGPDTVGLFYYAGHGVQSFGTNYLLPVDSSLLNAADLDLVAVEAQSVLRQMFSARNRTNSMILDACRNNPFTDIPEFNDNGLAEMDAPTGTFLAYATAPGNVALDGLTGNSPFTRSLAGYLATPGLPVEQMFKKVRIEVLEETDGAQTPWDSSSLTSDFMFAAPAVEEVAYDAGEEQGWRLAQASADLQQLITFLRHYPKSVHAPEARKLLMTVLEYELQIDLTPEPEVESATGPSEAEEKMFQLAAADGGATGYAMYLRMFPRGVYVDLARLELAALQQRSVDLGDQTQSEDVAALTQPDRTVTFIDPLTSDVPEVDGKSIAILMNSTPLYPPMADLPEAYWKGQACGSCHKWSEDRLCDHATRYLSQTSNRSLAKLHPFGGALKQNLRHWAAGGCR